jgi:hypothetical protein
MSINILVSVKITDFEKYKAAFDSNASAREETGLSGHEYQKSEDPNHAIVIATAPSKEVFVGFFSKPVLKEVQQRAGVLSPPEVTFLSG